MYFRIILLCSCPLIFYVETDGGYIAFKLASSTWMGSQGCASTATPFKLSPFSLAIISYSPVPFLCSQTACLPSSVLVLSFLFPGIALWRLSPVLSLTPALPEDTQGLLPSCSPWGAQPAAQPWCPTLFHPPLYLVRSEASSQPVFSAVGKTLLTILGKFLPPPFTEKSCKATTLQARAWLRQTISVCVPVGQDTRYSQESSSRRDILVQNWE